jgi:hypothetical protein
MVDRGEEEMSNKTAVILTCSHSDPQTNNDRYTWLGKFLYDLKPDYVVDLGDGADMRSLNSYDTRKPEAIVSQSYEKDIDHYNDSQERLRHYFKANKRKKPAWYGFEGNHEHRIKTALSFDPRLEGKKYGISFKHLQTNKWFDEYHEYEHGAPKIHNYDGVDYAHFVGAGNFGRAISGTHHAYGLIQNRYRSCTVGHSHKRDMWSRAVSKALRKIGLGKRTLIGGKALSSRELFPMVYTSHRLLAFRHCDGSMHEDTDTTLRGHK